MSHPFERFCKEIRWVFDTGDVFYIHEMTIHTVTNEVNADVDVFHAVVRMWIVRAHDRPLVVTVKNTGFILGEAEFKEKGAKPDDLSRAMRARNVFRLAGRQSNDCLLFGRPRNRAVAAHDDISRYGFPSFRHGPI